MVTKQAALSACARSNRHRRQRSECVCRVLERWLCEGVVNDPYGEFTVQEHKVIRHSFPVKCERTMMSSWSCCTVECAAPVWADIFMQCLLSYKLCVCLREKPFSCMHHSHSENHVTYSHLTAICKGENIVSAVNRL